MKTLTVLTYMISQLPCFNVDNYRNNVGPISFKSYENEKQMH